MTKKQVIIALVAVEAMPVFLCIWKSLQAH